MTKTRFIKGFAACLLIVGGCRNMRPAVVGSGVSKTETRSVADFDEIEMNGIGRLDATIGPLSPLSVTADDNLLPLIETTVRGRTLVIRERQDVRPKSNLVFKVAIPNLKSVGVSGIASAQVAGVKNDSLAIRINGAGDVRLVGQTDKFDFQLNGTGSLNAYELSTKSAVAEISGTGSAELNVTAELKAKVSGIGSITYIGDPKVESHVSGLGKVSKKH